MPTYVYECNNCGIRFERKQHMLDDAIKVCPECEGSVRRVLFPVGIVFKGSGFYATDNRRGSAHNGEAGEESSPKSESSEATAESKPEPAKAESKTESKADAGVAS